MTTRPVFAIVGAGLAGVRAAETLRSNGFVGRVLLFGREAELPYNRPPLSKDYLQGLCEKDKIYLHPPDYYADHEIELHLGTTVAGIDLAGHRLTLDAGGPVEYDRLLLATGSSARRLPVPGVELDGVLSLRTLGDSEALAKAFAAGGRVVIIGAGWIGLECAAAARAAGAEVTVLERSRLPLLRTLGPELGRIYYDLHRRHGVRVMTGSRVDRIRGRAGRVIGVHLADGAELSADTVVVGVGASPHLEPATAAGLDVGDGIIVDAHLATSHPGVFAAGDIAAVPYPPIHRRLRLEHWSAAYTQGAVAAAAMTGADETYDEVPYFFSDQYEMGMEYRGSGVAADHERVVFRGEPAQGAYLAFWLADGRVGAVMNVNIWDQGEPIEALIRSGSRIDPGALADPTVPLEELVAPRRGPSRRAPRAQRQEPGGAAVPAGRISVLVTQSLSPHQLSSIRSADARVDVAQLTDPAQASERMRSSTPDVVFGIPEGSAAQLSTMVRRDPGLRWVQVTTPAAHESWAAAALTPQERTRVAVTGADAVYAPRLAELALDGALQAGGANGGGPQPLAERTVLVVGLGAVGRAVATRAGAMGAIVLGVSRTGRRGASDVQVERTPRFLGDLLPRADVVVVAAPGAAETRGLIGPEAFAHTRTGALVVDLGGEAVIDLDELRRALETGLLSGAVIVGPSASRLPVDSALRDRPDVIITPMAPTPTRHESEQLVAGFVANLRGFLAGDDLRDRLGPGVEY